MPLEISMSQNGDLYFLLLNEWMRSCDTGHRDHNAFASSPEPELPKRVLDVEYPDNESHLRLLRTEGRKGRYVTLSHRWGVESPLLATKATFKALCDGIQVNQLPLLFLDAITVARKLGVRWLWIDSLCIIQDDKADWEQEAAKMGDIFSHAYCTLAASSAQNCYETLLVRRPSAIYINLLDGVVRLDTNTHKIDVDFGWAVERGHLSERAWIFQERMLSKRTIHFTARHTYWECGSVIRDEMFRQFIPPPE
jgi:hypothetical protein